MPSPTNPVPSPRFARLLDVVRTYPLSRTQAYELAGAGRLRLVKLAGRTLVDLDSLDSLLAALPPAKLRAPRAAARQDSIAR
ncbi:hypothetical protein [Acidisphaera rubrifaciens]|uniref:Helix-turn-helix domain-containing protein n=1 Tax=Acidisphaera rubrifaciens HS-AP3 TaxID=1231350 RepID=A0A0D6P3P7_9PROT|nr:hypothetical protein [Acidisphaera rubrifaciens]GAN76272.1 hypothetical protein Asru_0081_08 [Acidisphaera rubrifaciens HS-AP3]